ncbi:MAG: histidine kinase, partial [Clostridiales bacterium]|nr:histidine kinase [Clostridiales bacterium]
VNVSVNTTRNTSIFIGLFLLALMVFVVLASIKLITTPLTSLAHWVRRVGTGNFSAVETLEGSYEIKGLSEDANQMTKGIQDLIDSTYVAQINERTAKLTALEAQTNPHFLFNTLQAISSQAILDHQDDIYKMVSSLASILRYSIRGGNLDTLETELEQVRMYLFLQKTRFGERLTYDFSVDENILSINVPKFCILSLTENSMIHGIKENVTDIAIRITASTDEENVIIRVSDNGYGIDGEALSRIRCALENPDLHISENIGLINLASRLRLLYGNKARMLLESQSAPARSTSVSILIPLEVLGSVQSHDR